MHRDFRCSRAASVPFLESIAAQTRDKHEKKRVATALEIAKKASA